VIVPAEQARGRLSTRVAVVGEVIADLLPDESESTSASDRRLVAKAGGSPANVAVGLSRLGVRAVFLGRLATAGLGPWLADHLKENGVSLVGPDVSAVEPCSLAVVTLDPDGIPVYSFHVAGAADYQWRRDELPDLAALEVTAIHAGSLALALEPACTVLGQWLAELSSAGILVSVDPNVRGGLVEDLAAYRETLESVFERTHVLKASDEDLETLYPGETAIAAATRWADRGVMLVVVTHGAGGATAIRRGHDVVHRAALPVDVVDTIGAGDSFMAAILGYLVEHESLTPSAVAELSDADVAAALEFAVTAAAITCSRCGADAPHRFELPNAMHPSAFA
jgi:fructokinase